MANAVHLIHKIGERVPVVLVVEKVGRQPAGVISERVPLASARHHIHAFYEGYGARTGGR